MREMDTPRDTEEEEETDDSCGEDKASSGEEEVWELYE